MTTTPGPSIDVLQINMQTPRDLVATGHHVHSCPICYEHVPCYETCSVEPDLDLDDGTLRGAYHACAGCSA